MIAGILISGKPRLAIAMFYRYLAVLLTLLCSAPAWSAPGRWEMGTDTPLAVLEDRAGVLAVEQVAGLPDASFRALSAGLSAGYSDSVYWLKFPVPPSVGRDGLLLELGPAYVDEIELFEPDGKAWRKRLGGDLQPYAEREIGYRNFVFHLSPADAGKTLFLRVRSSSTVVVRGLLWEPAAFTNAVIPEMAVIGAYFGIFGLSMVLALAYGFWLRSRVFFAYALLATLAMLTIASFNGLHAQTLFPRAPQIASDMVGFFVILLQAWAVGFTMVLLETAVYFPRFHRIMRMVAILIALSSISAFTGYYRWFAALVNPLCWTFSAAGGTVLSLLLVRRKVPGARLFVFAYSVHALATLSTTLLIFGLMRPNLLTIYGWQGEALIHVLLLHSAMLWRLRNNERKYIRAQERALTASVEAERLLETRVCGRTRELTEARNRLESALASERRAHLEQRQFMSMVSHEFRTPLAIIDSVAVNLTEVPATDSADMLQRSEQIQRATRRLARLVDNCLTDDRLDSGAFSLQRKSVSPRTLAREAAEIVQWSPKHRLVLALDGLPESIECDPTLVRIALSNLLDNAVKYSEGGCVELAAAADASGVSFMVADEGPGLGEGEPETLFERFARGTAKKTGAGLGLYVVRRIARLHGGDAYACNLAGGGALFELRILRG